jgi:iron complex transport system substrate-binding protein
MGMRSAHRINTALLVAAVAAGVLLTASLSGRGSPVNPVPGPTVTDAVGTQVPVREYSRIVSTSTIADQVLVDVIDPRRLLAVSAHTQRMGKSAEFADKIGVERARDIETIIELRPDIVFVNNFVDRRHVERFKDAGLNVFDLGEMRGLQTLPDNIRQVAGVVAAPERGERLAAHLLDELAEISADIPEAERKRGLYVGIHGDRLYGGTKGTSFHDVIVAGGLIDVAAEAGFHSWPAFTNEQMLSLDPPWIITNPGTEDALCEHPGLGKIEACARGQVRSIETDLLTDPGLGMVEAARAVREAIYGR